MKPRETRTIGSLVDRQPLAAVRTTSTNWKTGPKQGRGSLTPTLAPECQLGVSFFALCFLPPRPHARRLPRESPAQALQPHDLELRMFFEALSIPFAPSTTSRLTADFSAAIGTLRLSGGEKEAPVSGPGRGEGLRSVPCGRGGSHGNSASEGWLLGSAGCGLHLYRLHHVPGSELRARGPFLPGGVPGGTSWESERSRGHGSDAGHSS